MEGSGPLLEAREPGAASSDQQQPNSSSTSAPQPLPAGQSSFGSSFVILDEDEEELEISIPLDGGDGPLVEGDVAAAIPFEAPAAALESESAPVPVEQDAPQQVEDFFTGDEAFVSAAAAPVPAPSVAEPEALPAAEPDAGAAAAAAASVEQQGLEEEIALTVSSSPVLPQQPDDPVLSPVADPEPRQQPKEPAQEQQQAPEPEPAPVEAEAEDDEFGDFAAPTEVASPPSIAPAAEPVMGCAPAAAVEDEEEFGDFEAPPAVDAPDEPQPLMEQPAPAVAAPIEGGGEQEAEEEEEEEFGDFETPPPPPRASAEAVEAEAPVAAAEPTQEPEAAGDGFEDEDFNDFGDNVEFVSAAPPAPAPAVQTPAEAPPQEAAVGVSAAPIPASSGAPDAGGDPRAFFEAAYGQGLGPQPSAGKASSWAAGQRRRLLVELDANLDARCQTLGQARLEPRASPWAAAILRKELLSTMPGGGHLGDGGLRLSTPQEEDGEGDGESSENAISITWALASSPAPPRFEPPTPPPQVPTTAPKAAVPAAPAALASAPARAPVVDDTSDLDLDFLAGPTGSSSNDASLGSSSGSGGLDGSVSALSQTLLAMGLGDEPPTLKANAATATAAAAAATFSSLSLSSSAPPSHQPPMRTGPLSAEAEAVIAEVPDLGFVLSKVPFLPHHHLAMGASASAAAGATAEKEGSK